MLVTTKRGLSFGSRLGASDFRLIKDATLVLPGLLRLVAELSIDVFRSLHFSWTGGERDGPRICLSSETGTVARLGTKPKQPKFLPPAPAAAYERMAALRPPRWRPSRAVPSPGWGL